MWADLISELFESYVGIISIITILVVVVIAAYMFFWVKKQANTDGESRQ
ncbi:DUF3149 domain-containing protein [Stenoxybacter acetivorans]|nr:DUF3149 domain-containing protein [Stenoxybacter acetivorans]